MNLATHSAVLWRYRGIVAGGVLLGVVLAVLASYQGTWDGGPKLTPRGSETWTSESSLLVTQTGFPEGRVTLPEVPTPSEGSVEQQTPEQSGNGRLEFADPLRFAFLAQLYAQLAVSDRVVDQLPKGTTRAQIEAIPVEGLAATQLPLIKLTTTAGSSEAARGLNTDVVKALQGVLADDQATNDIQAPQRTRVELLNAPAGPVMTAGRSHTGSILALLLCVLGAVGVAHLLAALRDKRHGQEGPTDFGAIEIDELDLDWNEPVDSQEAPAPWPADDRDSVRSIDPKSADDRRSSGSQLVR